MRLLLLIIILLLNFNSFSQEIKWTTITKNEYNPTEMKARGIVTLEALVNSGEAAVAFSLAPVEVQQLLAVSDAGDIMPPKSTWFDPKPLDGLVAYDFE